MASDRAIILVHGTGHKPGEQALLKYWQDAMRIGLQRDSAKMVERFENSQIQMLYYADSTTHAATEYDQRLDLAQRQQVLDKLGEARNAKDFRRRHYEQLPGKTPLKEFMMDAAATIGFGGIALTRVLPELKSYWEEPEGWPGDARSALTEMINQHLRADRKVLIVAHCLGSVIAYDALWAMRGGARVDTLVTLGSPLASRSVVSHLAGASEVGTDRYPQNILNWHNISAEDDYVCHDKTVADDFQEMLDKRVIGNITDDVIYNLAVRFGRSNPHHSAGYLVHPRFTRYLSEWLRQ